MELALKLPGFSNIVSPVENKFPAAETTLGTIITELLPYVFGATGILLFVYFLVGGFQLLTSAGEPKAVEGARARITNAIIGFVIIFIAYWLIQILQSIFGVGIE